MAAKKKMSAKTNGKASNKKLSKAPVVRKVPTIKDPLTKGGMMRAIGEMTGVSKRDITGTLEALAKLVELHVKSRGPGKFVLPGLLKIVVVKKPARPARKGINPFTGQEMMFKAKPAYKVVKIRALKKLKEMVD